MRVVTGNRGTSPAYPKETKNFFGVGSQQQKEHHLMLIKTLFRTLMLALVAMVLGQSSVNASIPRCTDGVTTTRASWYGKPFHGRIRADGKEYDMNDAETVAHKTLPFGTKVRFRNPTTGRMLVAVVRDRGPFIPGRSFDLSLGGSRVLGTTKSGVASLLTCIVR